MGETVSGEDESDTKEKDAASDALVVCGFVGRGILWIVFVDIVDVFDEFGRVAGMVIGWS